MKKPISDASSVDSLLKRFARTTEEVISLAELRARLLSGRQLVMKYGVDLTAPDMHIGHAVNLWMYRALQELGHKVILLLGDFTTQIGDPTGRNKTRPVLSQEQIATNAEGIFRQASKILISDPDVFEVRRNSEWLGSMSPLELLTLMSGVTVDKLLSRDMFRKRMERKQSIASHELIYPLLQGWDSVVLKSDLTVIGSDQLFNEMIGRTLQEKQQQTPQVVITTKITPGIDGGEKQSKSLGNYIAVDHSPRDKFGRLMSIPDTLISTYAAVYTDLHDDVLAALDKQIQERPRDAKASMAQAVVARYHGDTVALEEREWFARTFSAGEMPVDAPKLEVGTESTTVFDLCKRAVGNDVSRGEVRRLIVQGGVRLDGQKLLDPDSEVKLDIGEHQLKIGKRQWFKVERIS